MRALHLLIASGLLLPQAALAQVYKCTARDGSVTYSQTQPKNGACKENPLRPTDPTGADSGSVKQFSEDIDASRKAEAEARQKKDLEAAQVADRQASCRAARSALAFLEQASRLSVIDESGERHYQDEGQKEQMKAEAQARIDANCN